MTLKFCQAGGSFQSSHMVTRLHIAGMKSVWDNWARGWESQPQGSLQKALDCELCQDFQPDFVSPVILLALWFNEPTCVKEKLLFQVWDMFSSEHQLYKTHPLSKISVSVGRPSSYDVNDQALKLISLSHISGSGGWEHCRGDPGPSRDLNAYCISHEQSILKHTHGTRWNC